MNFLLLLLAAGAHAALLLNEDFSCASLGCNETAQPTNYSLWRWSTTGSAQAYMHLANATDTARGTAVHFDVEYCDPPSPNPTHLGCYRSELALQRAHQNDIIDWASWPGKGSSVRRGVGPTQ